MDNIPALIAGIGCILGAIYCFVAGISWLIRKHVPDKNGSDFRDDKATGLGTLALIFGLLIGALGITFICMAMNPTAS